MQVLGKVVSIQEPVALLSGQESDGVTILSGTECFDVLFPKGAVTPHMVGSLIVFEMAEEIMVARYGSQPRCVVSIDPPDATLGH
jgi:hypothetical protein